MHGTMDIYKKKQVLYLKTNIHFSLEWEIFRTTFVETNKTNILCSTTFIRKSRRLWDNAEKYGTEGQATDDNMAHAHYMLDT